MFWQTKAFERLAPVAFGILSFATIAIFSTSIAAKFEPNGWDSSSLYAAVFNWASIQSGFVFGIYGFIATKKDGFAGIVAKAQSFDQFLAYARRAYMSGFALTFSSLPIMVMNPQITDPHSPEFWSVALWFAASIWTFCAFLRVAFIFGIIAAVPDKRPGIVG